MNEIQKLIDVTQTLCCTLDLMSDNERKFGCEVAHSLEMMSYDAYKMSMDLKALKDYVIGV